MNTGDITHHRTRSRFYLNLATTLNSGITIERTLDTIKLKKTGFLYHLLDDIQFQVGSGASFGEALERHRSRFPDLDIAVIKGGERSGRLAEALLTLSRYYEQRRRERNRFIAGMLYPLILLHFAILLPPLKFLFTSGHSASYFRAVAPTLLIGYGALFLGSLAWKFFLKDGTGREKFDGLILFLPKIGRLLNDTAIQRVLWALAIQLESGAEAVSAARNAAAAAGNKYIRNRLELSMYVLETGRSFKDYFMVSGSLNSDQLSVLTVGEMSGQIPGSLLSLAKLMEAENSARLTSLIKTAIWFTYFVAALIAAITVLSFYSQYFSILA